MRPDLQTIPVFAHLQAADLRLGRALEERAYKNRARVFREGDACTGLHIAKGGQVKLSRTSPGKELRLSILAPGELLDPIPVLDDGTHSVTATARGTAGLNFLARDRALERIWNHPPVLSAVLHSVSERLRHLATLASDLAFKDVTAGAAREVIWRSLKKLEEEGLIKSNVIRSPSAT